MPSDQNLEMEVQRLKSAVEELTLLNELALAASSSMDVNQVLDTIVQKSIRAVRAEQGTIMLVTPQEDSPLKTLIRKEDFSGQMDGYRVGANITGWVLKHKQPLIVEDLAHDDRFKVTEKEIGEIRSVLCLPVMSRGQIIGVLTLTNKKTGESFSPGDMRLVSIIAAQSGQLIHNSQLQLQAVEKKRMEHQLELARDIQQQLLPSIAMQNDHLEIAGYFKPADEVGGDYFDYFQLDETRLGIVIADVSGHGAAAALVMTLLKGILHTRMHHFESPQQVLTEVNDTISAIIPDDMFVTMQLLVIDPLNKKFQMTNAGHNPLLYFSQSHKKCYLIEMTGCALNVMPGYQYSNKVQELDKNDFLLVYTDGINEAVNSHSELFTIKRLIASIEAGKHDSAGTLIKSVKNDLDKFTDAADQADDMVMIAIRIK
jgi:sigma-B regulation protein RsbU (phosphoserine phosphatase)